MKIRTRRRRRTAFAVIATVGGLLTLQSSRPAYAGVNASACKIPNSSGAGPVGFTITNGTLTASSTLVGTVRVVCPFPKTTSGPGLFNDWLSGVTVTQTSPRAGDVSCTVREFTNRATDRTGSSLISLASATASSTVAGASTLTLPGFSWDTFWDMPATADLVCDLKANASLSGYSWTENGPAQVYRLYPPMACAPTADSAYYYESSAEGVGFLEGKTGPFQVSCPISAADPRGVELELGPSLGNAAVYACTHDGTHWVNVPKNNTGSDYPTVRMQFAVAPGAQAITCRRTNATEGDPKVFGYRTFPLTRLSHTGWMATASLNPSAAPNAIDDSNTGDRWSTGTGQNNSPAENQWFQLNLGGAKTFHEIVLSSAASANDYPRSYNVYASNSTSSWGTPIASGVGTADAITIPVPPTTAQYIRITQTSNTPSRWWSITKLDLYVAKTP
jgi:hypothetical protein